MAYSDAPFGFRPVRHRNGAPYNGACTPYWVDADDSGALYIGDPVIIDGTSNTAAVKIAGGVFQPGTLQGVTKQTAAATNRVTGVVVAVAAVTGDSVPYRVASTERVVYVADDPDLLFEVQVDEALATSAVGLNTITVLTHSGSTVTGQSGAEVDATASADATYAWKIEGFVNDPWNVANAAGNRVLVSAALHTANSAGGVLGVA
jgi:hypothetical protein